MTFNQTSQTSSRASRRAGFSLLELLVSISIIGILIAMGSVAFSTAQQKSRDAKRRADVKAVAGALEQYYANNSSVYPDSASCTTFAGLSTYFSGPVPLDPKTGGSYTCVSEEAAFCVCALLDEETKGNASGVPNGDGTCNYASGGTHYCMNNQQ